MDPSRATPLTQFDSLRRVGIFSELTEPEVRTLGAVCDEVEFQAGDRVIADGARGEGLFILLSGTASVLKFAGSQGEIELARLHPGEHFGEMSLVSERPASASVRADSALVCLFASRRRFDRLLRDNPDIARKVLASFVTTLSRRLTEIDLHYARAIRKARRQEAVRHVVLLSALQWRMLISYAWIWFRRSVLHRPMSADGVSATHRRYAHRFKQLASQLKGATVKIAQVASLQQALIPAEYLDEFKSLRDQVAPSEYPLVAGRIQAELGAGPLEVFSEFSRAPLAAASMGQVHRARLPSGEDVVVKVLHPGVEQSVLIDLWITRSTLWALNWFVPKIDLMQIYRESREPLLEELDLLHEARATEELGKALHPLGVRVPKIHWQYSTRRVLTLEFVEGVTLNNVGQMKAWNVDRVELARTYLRAFLHQALTGGFFHADPHPGNAFCTPEGRLVLLDFGMVKRLPDRVRKGLAKEWMGAFFKNPRMYVDGVIEKGGIAEEDREYLEQQAARVFSDDRLRDFIFDHNTAGGASPGDVVGEFTTILGGLKSFKTPQDELMFLRGLGICADVVKEMVPEMKVTEVGEPVYADLFRKVMAENPAYASGPFRLTLRDADLAGLLQPELAKRGFRDLSVACRPGVISAQVVYPFTRFGLGELRVTAVAAPIALDPRTQTIDLRITSVEFDEAGEPGLLNRFLAMTGPMAQLFAQAPVGKRDLDFSWGHVTFPHGASLPLDARVNVSALALLGGPHHHDLRLDLFLVEEGRIVIGRGAGAA